MNMIGLRIGNARDAWFCLYRQRVNFKQTGVFYPSDGKMKGLFA